MGGRACWRLTVVTILENRMLTFALAIYALSACSAVVESKDRIWFTVGLVVSLSPVDVVDCLFAESDAYHKRQRRDVGAQVTDAERRNDL